MAHQAIPVEKLLIKSHAIWANQWLLLTVGNFKEGHFNTMTVGWGSFGTMWNKPFAQVVVRPTRYTYEFMNAYDTFTLCSFPPRHQQALQLLGTQSGREKDKIAKARLTPIAASRVAAPGFAEAELLIECRKVYWDDLEPEHFLDQRIESNYPLHDYHRIYFGEILAVSGETSYVSL